MKLRYININGFGVLVDESDEIKIGDLVTDKKYIGTVFFSESEGYSVMWGKGNSEDEILTPYNEEINSSGVSSWDISNSDDVLVIRPIEVDVPLINVN